MELTDKLEILADAAKYDASCASSGAPKRGSEGKNGMGATNGMGICRLTVGEVRNLRGYIHLFIVTADYTPAGGAAFSEVLRRSLDEAPQQVNLWPELQAA
jgi:hypothetical protein